MLFTPPLTVWLHEPAPHLGPANILSQVIAEQTARVGYLFETTSCPRSSKKLVQVVERPPGAGPVSWGLGI